MTVNQAIEFFKDNPAFVFEKKVYNVENVKSVSGLLVLITDKRTFNLFPSELDDFLDQCNVNALSEQKSFVPDPETVKALISNNSEPICVNVTENVIVGKNVVQQKEDKVVSFIENTEVNSIIRPDMWLPETSMKVKHKLDKMLDMFDEIDKIDDAFMKKASALCAITDRVVSVEKLEMDFVRLQTK